MINRPEQFVAPQVCVNGKPRISSVLIANRGEISCRIIDTCKKLGITSIAIYTDSDEKARFVKLADKAYSLGSAEQQPYLNGKLLIEIAQKFGADAIHPGYGYLSENASFAEAVRSAGLVFIGPSPGSIAALGDKREAKVLLATQSSVPLIPGYDGLDQDPELLETEADKIGYPVMIKASAGGGGKGMRIVHAKKDFRQALQSCVSEAGRLFGSPHCLIEKYIQAGKHVEMQIFGDGNTAISFLDRECSVQRRNQKIIEESPCPWLSDRMRQDMSESALQIAKLLRYESAGTVEYIVDIHNESFYFLEVNTRIQVEHPITEEVIGVDLVALQFYIAGGGRLDSLLELRNIKQVGHALEVRLCAEDPFHDFRPCTGTICHFAPSSEDSTVRYELGVEGGSTITIHFDSMISKIIVWAPTRTLAIQKMLRVLKHTVCFGLTTNQLFLQRILASPDFERVDYTTSLVPKNLANLISPLDTSLATARTAVVVLEISRLVELPSTVGPRAAFKNIRAAFRNQHKGRHISTTRAVSCDLVAVGKDQSVDMLISNDRAGVYHVAQVPEESPPTAAEKKEFFNKQGGPLVKRYYSALQSKTETLIDDLEILDFSIHVRSSWTLGELKMSVGGQLVTYHFAVASHGDFKNQIYVQESGTGVPLFYTVSSLLAWAGNLDEKANDARKADSRVSTCPMPSKILQVLAKDGTKAKIGDGLLVLESMKTEIRVTSAANGVVRMHVKEGEVHPEGTVLCEILEETEVKE